MSDKSRFRSGGVQSDIDALETVTTGNPVSGIRWVKCGKVVVVNIDYTFTANGSTWVQIATLPHKPKIEMFAVGKENAVDYVVNIDLDTNGKLSFTGTGSASHRIRTSLTYITA